MSWADLSSVKEMLQDKIEKRDDDRSRRGKEREWAND